MKRDSIALSAHVFDEQLATVRALYVAHRRGREPHDGASLLLLGYRACSAKKCNCMLLHQMPLQQHVISH